MKREKREQVYNKYNGHCAYCGKEIDYKDMQVDHVIPKATVAWSSLSPPFDVDGIDNLLPSCRMCNHYKRALDLEKFRRHWIGGLHERLKKIYIVRVALNFGIIKIQPHDGLFYFEKIQKEEE